MHHRLGLVVSPAGVAGTRRITAVVDPRGVRRPREPLELHEAQLVRQVHTVSDAAELPDLPVGPAVGQRIGDELAVRRGLVARERDGGVLARGVRVEQHPRRGIERIGHIEHALVLGAVVAGEEVLAALHARQPDALVVPELRQPLLDALALRQGFEPRLGERVLRAHELAGRGGRRVFHPPIGVGDLRAVVIVDHRAALGGGIGESRSVCGCGKCSERGQGHGCEDFQRVAMQHVPLYTPAMPGEPIRTPILLDGPRPCRIARL